MLIRWWRRFSYWLFEQDAAVRKDYETALYWAKRARELDRG
jgi:hypothetical protein